MGGGAWLDRRGDRRLELWRATAEMRLNAAHDAGPEARSRSWGDDVILSWGDGVILSWGDDVILNWGEGVILSWGDGVILSWGDGVG